MRCIKCGGIANHDMEIDTNPETNGGSPMKLKGFKCESCGETWSIFEHKDNQDWNVRHTRILEQKVESLTTQLNLQALQILELKENFNLLLEKLGV